MENSTASPSKTTTTPKKRKHSEYHDPDYGFHYDNPDSEKEKRAKLEQDSNSNDAIRTQQDVANNTPRIAVDSVAQLKRIEDIVRTEFQKELTLKEQQLSEIDNRLLQARQLLDKLRYHVVSEYYKKQQVTLTAADVARVRSRDTLFGDGAEHDGVQLPLHPAIKKIVGKRPAPIQLHLPERTAATLAKQTIRLRNPAHRRAERRRQQKIREQGIVTDHTQEEVKKTDAPSRDEQPCTSQQAYKRQQELEVASVPALNTSRLNNKNKFHFVVGNTSKYIGGADSEARDSRGSQGLAYKWLVYVQGKNLPQPLETYLKKVRFQLHHSYRPNDIVDVHSPPFQLTRRGWGEFPLRIQLYFQDHLQQKPVQLMHNIVLDKTMCGLHTMGGETTVEVWLRSNANATPEIMTTTTTPVTIKRESSTTTPAPYTFLLPMESSKPRTISITQNKEELDDNLFACINKIELSDDIEQIEPTVLVSEPLKLSSPKKTAPVLAPAPATPSKMQLRLNSMDTVSTMRPHASHLPLNGISSSKKQQNGHTKGQVKNVVFQKAGRLYFIDPMQSKLKQAAKQQSLLKPQLSLLKQPTQQLSKRWHILQCIQNDHGYANMSSHETMSVPVMPQSQRMRLEQLFNGIPFQSMRSAVEFLLRRLPLTGGLGNEYVFGGQTLSAFLAQPALRQRFFEYMRGRVLARCMRQHQRLQHLHSSCKEHFWSVREIVAFARLHGYTPPLKMLCVTREKAASKLAPLSERVQQQLKDEPQSQFQAYCSLTPRTRLDSWLTEQAKRLQCREQQLENQQIVDVLGLDPPKSLTRRPTHVTNNSNNQQMLYLPPPEDLDAASQLVRDMCKDVGIVLETEQSVPGVSQSLALTLLAHVLRMFVERLVRRAVASKLQQQQQQPHAIETLPPAAANLELALLPYDIGRVIAKSGELDFLGNCNLGVAQMDKQS
ncbi:uncharacterized protein LOC117781958 [Drosophila innubila]|uniref:uncharacterized protein LOC117781958 n=1 Tax=Drosophila innubila TaxID=198719 RepID=UPI00148C66A2|nr:uncharacterized protein LOC117781958 [Drosophila innubila]